MRIAHAIKKLQELQAKHPDMVVSFKATRPKRKAKRKLGVTARFRAWAERRCKDGRTFTFLEACLAYERIGGSAGTTTVLHRLSDIKARQISPNKAESHLRGEWTIDRTRADVPARELIELDPTFADRYEAQRRRVVVEGGLAPPPFDEARFEKSFGNKGIWLAVQDPDPDRRMRIKVVPDPRHRPTTN